MYTAVTLYPHAVNLQQSSGALLKEVHASSVAEIQLSWSSSAAAEVDLKLPKLAREDVAHLDCAMIPHNPEASREEPDYKMKDAHSSVAYVLQLKI